MVKKNTENIFCYSPSEMYYFAPKNAQNNKSSIVGRCLDVETLEDLLNTAQVTQINTINILFVEVK